MNKISKIKAREIIDSRGNPTVEVDVLLDDGSFGRGAVPSGASTGSHEAIELRDGDKSRFAGKGVLKAVKNVDEILNSALSQNVFDQQSLDKKMIELDGTKNKGNLGANAILGVSIAFSKAVAQSKKIPLYKYFGQIANIENTSLPVPMMNFINGGKHAENSSDFQEYMIVPRGFPTFRRALQAGVEVFHNLKKILHEKGLSTNVGDEGGFAPSVINNEMPLQLIIEAITKSGYKPNQEIFIAMDVAATELFKDNKYNLSRENKSLSSKEFVDYYKDLCSKYPIVSIEDGLSEDDWDGQKIMTDILGKKIQLVGDDLFVTNIERLNMGIQRGVANAILVKPNQIGTITETIDAVKTAYKNGYKAIISHRSGETEDTTISHLAVGLGTGQIKTGSVSRSERTSKYNEILRIEESDNIPFFKNI
jgi:enolase